MVELNAGRRLSASRRRDERGQQQVPARLGQRAPADQEDDTYAGRGCRAQDRRGRFEVVAGERAHRSARAARREQVGERRQHARGAMAATTSASNSGPPTLPGTIA